MGKARSIRLGPDQDPAPKSYLNTVVLPHYHDQNDWQENENQISKLGDPFPFLKKSNQNGGLPCKDGMTHPKMPTTKYIVNILNPSAVQSIIRSSIYIVPNVQNGLTNFQDHNMKKFRSFYFQNNVRVLNHTSYVCTPHMTFIVSKKGVLWRQMLRSGVTFFYAITH